MGDALAHWCLLGDNPGPIFVSVLQRSFCHSVNFCGIIHVHQRISSHQRILSEKLTCVSILELEACQLIKLHVKNRSFPYFLIIEIVRRELHLAMVSKLCLT